MSTIYILFLTSLDFYLFGGVSPGGNNVHLSLLLSEEILKSLYPIVFSSIHSTLLHLSPQICSLLVSEGGFRNPFMYPI